MGKVNIALLNKHMNYVTIPKFRTLKKKNVLKLSKDRVSLLIP